MSSKMATDSARASSSASDGKLLLLRFDAPAPDLCTERVASGLPPLKDRVRDTPLEEAGVVGAGDRDGEVRAGEVFVNGRSVDGGFRPANVPAGGFFVEADIDANIYKWQSCRICFVYAKW